MEAFICTALGEVPAAGLAFLGSAVYSLRFNPPGV
jgi:hypothetical protein